MQFRLFRFFALTATLVPEASIATCGTKLQRFASSGFAGDRFTP